MTCREISELAPLFFTGELDPARAAAFSEHIRNCPSCRQELAEQSAFDKNLRSAILAETVDASAIDNRVRTIIHTAPPMPHHRKQAIAGIAAVLVIGVAAYFELRSARTNPVALAAARDHRMEIVDRQPREWFTDRTAIEELAAKQGLPASVASGLTPAGYRLAQAKICYLDRHWFLHLVYENSLGNVSVYLRRVDNSTNSGIRLESFGSEHVAGFQRGPVTAVVVTNQPGDAVAHIAESASAQL